MFNSSFSKAIERYEHKYHSRDREAVEMCKGFVQKTALTFLICV